MNEPVIIEKATIYNKDCMEYMRGLPDKAFDLAIVDPPYGIGAENHQGKKENGWTQWEKKEWDRKPPSFEYFDELFRVSKNQIIWGANYMTKFLPPSMGWIVWDKKQRDFSLADGELAWSSFKRALRMFDYSRASALQDIRIHPTQKPIKLYEWLLTNYAKQGDKILDTHMGSGSSVIACNNLGFEIVACELDKDYFDAACKRIKQEAAQYSLFPANTTLQSLQNG